MKSGKVICETLKGIRREIAQANEIVYEPAECHHEGDCAGTCPRCESETRWLEGQLRFRQSLGKAVTIAGLGLGSLVVCSSCADNTVTAGDVEMDSTEVVVDSVNQLEGDIEPNPEVVEADKPSAEPQEIDGVTQLEDPNDNRDCPTK